MSKKLLSVWALLSFMIVGMGSAAAAPSSIPLAAPAAAATAAPLITLVQSYNQQAYFACISQANTTMQNCLRSCPRNPPSASNQCTSRCSIANNNACRHLAPRSTGSGRGMTR